MFVGLLFPSIYLRDTVSNRRWIIFGIWFACLMLVIGYYILTIQVMRMVPALTVFFHIVLTLIALFFFFFPQKCPLKRISDHFENRWVSVAGFFAIDIINIILGTILCVCGVSPAEGKGNEKWVNDRITELENDAKKLEEIRVIEISDTATIHYLAALSANIDSLGKPHLHSSFDSAFYYNDERIAPLSMSNIHKAANVKKELQEKFKLQYLKQLRNERQEKIYYMNNGELLVFDDKKFSSSYSRERVVKECTKDLELIGLNNIRFIWGEKSDESKDVSIK